MAFKINIAHKGKTYKLETEDDKLVGNSIGDKIKGDIINSDLEGYELEISGASDKAGFPGMPNLNTPNIRKELLTYGKGLRKKPKRGKKANTKPKGLRLRKTVRGKEISLDTIQINTKVLKEGKKKFNELFPETEKTKEEEKKD